MTQAIRGTGHLWKRLGNQPLFSSMWLLALAAIGCMALSTNSVAAATPEFRAAQIPTGKTITPTAATGAIFQDLNPSHPSAPELRAGQAVAIAVSPDGRTLAIQTSGYNRYFGPDAKLPVKGQSYVPELSTEYVFLFDIEGAEPRRQQVLTIPNTFQGLTWAPFSDRLFVSGGKDDTVVEFLRSANSFVPGRTFKFGHSAGIGLMATPETAGLAVSPDGKRLLAANLQNDSVSLVDLVQSQVVTEQDLRPGVIDPAHRGEPGGSYPRSIVWVSNDHAYVASERDREIISLSIVAGTAIHVVQRIPVPGQPVALLANRSGSRVYVTLDTTNKVLIFDSAHDTLVESLDITAPKNIYANKEKLGGANPNALALTPDEQLLLVSNGGENAVAVVRLGDRARDPSTDTHTALGRGDADGDDDDLRSRQAASGVIGLVPTGWYPTGVATSKDGTRWYVVNGKSETGPNSRWCQKPAPAKNPCIPELISDFTNTPANGFRVLTTQNQSVWQLEKAGFLTLPAPSTMELARLTKQVAQNDRFDQPRQSAADQRLFALLRARIRHIIYIITHQSII
jgi:DNA-binding beta-propeller fold protein YncE